MHTALKVLGYCCRGDLGGPPARTGNAPSERTELLCTVRGLLKKIKQSVLVGDRVRVAGIDWEDRRGARAPLCPRCY
jgi:hypothetical protein